MGSENKILEALKKLKEAPAGVLSRETGFSTAYVDILCSSLIKAGKITKAEGKYSLAGPTKTTKKARPPKSRSQRTSGEQRKKRKRPKKMEWQKDGWIPEWLKK